MKTVYVCTIHFKVLDRGVWKSSKWSETMAQRYELDLKEGCCDTCVTVVQRTFRAQWEMREWKRAGVDVPLPSSTPLSA